MVCVLKKLILISYVCPGKKMGVPQVALRVAGFGLHLGQSGREYGSDSSFADTTEARVNHTIAARIVWQA